MNESEVLRVDPKTGEKKMSAAVILKLARHLSTQENPGAKKVQTTRAHIDKAKKMFSDYKAEETEQLEELSTTTLKNYRKAVDSAEDRPTSKNIKSALGYSRATQKIVTNRIKKSLKTEGAEDAKYYHKPATGKIDPDRWNKKVGDKVTISMFAHKAFTPFDRPTGTITKVDGDKRTVAVDPAKKHNPNHPTEITAHHGMFQRYHKYLKETMDSTKDHIEQTLADKDINSKVDGNTVKVHHSNVAKTKSILKKMGHSHSVQSGLNEESDNVEEADTCWKKYKQLGFKMKDGKRVPNCVPEETDLAEVSTDLLTRYKKSASIQATAADRAGNFKKADKRFSGIIKATKKQFANDSAKKQTEAMEVSPDDEKTPATYTRSKDGRKIRKGATGRLVFGTRTGNNNDNNETSGE